MKRNTKIRTYHSSHGSFEAPRTSFNSNTVKAKALSELENPNTIYILGNTPTYLHSSEVYWKAGLATAENTLRKNLFKLADEQKRIMKTKISFIEQQWKELLSCLGMTWPEFQKKYTEIYNQGGTNLNSEYWHVLSLLRQMKTLKTTLRGIKQIKDRASTPEERARQLIEAGFYTEGDIVFSKNGKTIKQYKKSETNIEHKVQQAYDRALKELISSPVYASFREDQKRAIEQIIITGDDGKTVRPPKFDTALGTLQETLEQQVFQMVSGSPEEIVSIIENNANGKNLQSYIASCLQGDNKNGLQVVNIAGEKWMKNYKKLNTDIFKADSLDVLTIEGKTISFFSTMKTGQVFDYTKSYVEGQPPPIVERFTASIKAPENLNFSSYNERTNSSSFHKNQGDNIQKLMNYVYRNAVTSATEADIKNFRDYTISYFIWLRLLNEIIGTPKDNYVIPLALKIHDSIYSTADILQQFVNKDALYFMQKGFTAIRKESLQDFYTWKYAQQFKTIKRRSNKQKVLNPEGRGSDLYYSKTKAIEVLVAFDGGVSYKKLYNAISHHLETFAISKMRLPTFETQLAINMDNVTRLLF